MIMYLQEKTTFHNLFINDPFTPQLQEQHKPITISLFVCGATAPIGPGPPQSRGF